jgi:hypothetical protein
MSAELRTSVDIDATPERVWHVLTDLPAYAEWNPFVNSAEGAVVVGGRLSVSAPPVNAFVQSRLHPRVLEVAPFRRLRVWSRLDRLGTGPHRCRAHHHPHRPRRRCAAVVAGPVPRTPGALADSVPEPPPADRLQRHDRRTQGPGRGLASAAACSMRTVPEGAAQGRQ